MVFDRPWEGNTCGYIRVFRQGGKYHMYYRGSWHDAASGEAGNIDLLMDISIPVIARLGATEMRIRDILQLLPGSIVELDKLAGDPVDLFVRGKLFAQGEVVVVDESFGIRVTKILDPSEKAAALAGA
jgi:flagellar motor switch protein FliN